MLIGRILYQEVEEKAVVSLQPTRLPNCQTQSESFLRTAQTFSVDLVANITGNLSQPVMFSLP